MITPYAFTAIGSYVIKDRGTIYTGYSPWNLSDREKIVEMVGEQITVYYDGRVVIGKITDVETFAKFPGPSVGESVGILVDHE